jgi:hypothetical protein
MTTNLKAYPGDLTRAQAELLLPLIPPGKKGGRPKSKENPRVSDGIPTGNPWVSDGIPMANPSETHQEPIREDKKRERDD